MYVRAIEIVQELRPALVPEIAREARAILTGEAPGRFFAAHNARCLAELIGYAGHAAPRLMARLGELLDWPYWRVRWQAVRALGMLSQGIPETILQHLSALLDDPDSPAVRQQTRITLEHIASARAQCRENAQG